MGRRGRRRRCRQTGEGDGEVADAGWVDCPELDLYKRTNQTVSLRMYISVGRLFDRDAQSARARKREKERPTPVVNIPTAASVTQSSHVGRKNSSNLDKNPFEFLISPSVRILLKRRARFSCCVGGGGEGVWLSIYLSYV